MRGAIQCSNADPANFLEGKFFTPSSLASALPASTKGRVSRSYSQNGPGPTGGGGKLSGRGDSQSPNLNSKLGMVEWRVAAGENERDGLRPGPVGNPETAQILFC